MNNHIITPKNIGIFAAVVFAFVLVKTKVGPWLDGRMSSDATDAGSSEAAGDGGSGARAAENAVDAAMIPVPQLPATLAEAEPKLVPVVRERVSHEIARIIVSPQPLNALRPEPPHIALTDDLWGVLAYQTENQFVRIDAETLTRWGTTFDKAWINALASLDRRSMRATTTLTEGGVRELHFGDGNDSARLLIGSTFAKLNLAGDPVIGIPKEDLLLVASADDEKSLRALADRLVDEWEKSAQNARVVRISQTGVVPFTLPPTHPLFARFEDLQRSADQHDERRQREALKKKLGEGDDVPFVASLQRVKNPKTNEDLSFIVHTEDTPSLLPRGDYVVFRRVDLEKKTATTLACGKWERVSRLMTGRWKETPFHARWLATDLPTAKELEELGCDHPALRADLGIARSTQ
jgi:hypothetical protein